MPLALSYEDVKIKIPKLYTKIMIMYTGRTWKNIELSLTLKN